jgi:hypothetical protein
VAINVDVEIRGCGNQGGRGRAPSLFQDITCQIWKKYGHPANECWWVYEDRDDHDIDNQNDKGCAYGVHTNWYINMGVTNHITSELNRLHVHDDYRVRDQVHNASCAGLEI